MSWSWPRIRALMGKEFAELRRNPGALAPVALLALVGIAMPLLMVLLIPSLTGEPLAADTELKEMFARVASQLPGAAALGEEAALQAFLLSRFLFLLLMVPVTGAVTFAGYSLVGEKQGRTLEPLLATPITTAELLVAKVLGALLPSLGIMLVAYGVYVGLIAVVAAPGVLRAVLAPSLVLAALGLGPMASLAGLQVAVLVSSRVNDPRTAQQVATVVILPLTALFISQMSGLFVLTVPILLVILAALVVLWILLVMFGVALFEREHILTRWK